MNNVHTILSRQQWLQNHHILPGVSIITKQNKKDATPDAGREEQDTEDSSVFSVIISCSLIFKEILFEVLAGLGEL